MKHESTLTTSFALEYRKRLFAEQRAAVSNTSQAQREPGPLARPPADAEATAGNRARVFGALLVAGLVLAVFNSEGLTHWARGLSETAAGRQVFAWSLEWHGLMEATSANRLVTSLRGGVASARTVAWEDVTHKLGFGSNPADNDMARSLTSGNGTAAETTGSIPSVPPVAIQTFGER